MIMGIELLVAGKIATALGRSIPWNPHTSSNGEPPGVRPSSDQSRNQEFAGAKSCLSGTEEEESLLFQIAARDAEWAEKDGHKQQLFLNIVVGSEQTRSVTVVAGERRYRAKSSNRIMHPGKTITAR